MGGKKGGRKSQQSNNKRVGSRAGSRPNTVQEGSPPRQRKRDKKGKYKTQQDYYDEVGPFRELLAARGLSLRIIRADGNCLFRSVSDQLYGNDSLHATLRQKCCDCMEAMRPEFEPFVADEEESFEKYLRTMREDGEWAGQPELMALAWSQHVNIMVYQLDQPAYRIECPAASGTPPVINVSYHDGLHYNSVWAEHQCPVRDARSANEPMRVLAVDNGRSNATERTEAGTCDTTSAGHVTPAGSPRNGENANADAVEDALRECDAVTALENAMMVAALAESAEDVPTPPVSPTDALDTGIVAKDDAHTDDGLQRSGSGDGAAPEVHTHPLETPAGDTSSTAPEPALGDGTGASVVVPSGSPKQSPPRGKGKSSKASARQTKRAKKEAKRLEKRRERQEGMHIPTHSDNETPPAKAAAESSTLNTQWTVITL
eukprot:m.1140725 g.1140725  ORF g.1140725 m.1140725 type:complete len:431 (-) comp24448_c3_seq2:2674-3966(-)